MDFKDLEDGHPDAPGIYEVISKGAAGEKEFKAEWKPGIGIA